MNSKYIIDIKKADLFIQDRQILYNINWQVKKSEHWFVLGPNGAGKTTLTRMLLGYLWPRFSAEISVLGNTYGRCDLFEVRKNIAWISPYLQNWTSDPKWTVEDIVISGKDSTVGLFRKVKPSERKTAADILSVLSCRDIIKKPFVNLSSGEQIKVLIARALIGCPSIMILDEACAHLDLKSREFLLSALRDLAAGKNSPVIIFVTQRIEDIIPEFEKGLIIRNGRIVASGTRESVLTETNLGRTFGVRVTLIRTKNGRFWPVVN